MGGGAPGPVAMLADYWAGHAAWKLVRKYTLANTGWPYGYGAGAHITPAGHDWYLFGRKLQASAAAGCSLTPALTTQVRKSSDKGVTWSAPVDLFSNDPGSPWECAATDGDAFYDAQLNLWHYQYQCLGVGTPWNGCHAQRVGDPMGAFTAPHPNPSQPAGLLWKAICDQPSDDCSQLAGGVHKVFDEGTYNIFDRDPAGFYFVAFHGYDGVHGYRGVAKTQDFQTWVAGDAAAGVPADAILDLKDAAPFREEWNPGGPIGMGAGSILHEAGYYYGISEVGDISLGCIAGQRWDWGMFRSATLTNTTWDQLPAGNPFLYSSDAPENAGKPFPCNPAYTRMFRDPETQEIYLHTTRESADPAFAGIYLYRLTPSTNVLPNGDLWTCHNGPWTVFPIGPTNLVTYRHPNDSSDGNCYLATNCGAASCAAGQSVYQDIPVGLLAGKKVRFGGSFATDAGTGALDIALLSLDAGGKILSSATLHTAPSPGYKASEEMLTVDPGAVTLRYQLYLNSTETFRADEMFVEPLP
jgi:hypothetical protein